LPNCCRNCAQKLLPMEGGLVLLIFDVFDNVRKSEFYGLLFIFAMN
jgi:hypothetical protein